MYICTHTHIFTHTYIYIVAHNYNEHFFHKFSKQSGLLNYTLVKNILYPSTSLYRKQFSFMFLGVSSLCGITVHVCLVFPLLLDILLTWYWLAHNRFHYKVFSGIDNDKSYYFVLLGDFFLHLFPTDIKWWLTYLVSFYSLGGCVHYYLKPVLSVALKRISQNLKFVMWMSVLGQPLQ